MEQNNNINNTGFSSDFTTSVENQNGTYSQNTDSITNINLSPNNGNNLNNQGMINDNSVQPNLNGDNNEKKTSKYKNIIVLSSVIGIAVVAVSLFLIFNKSNLETSGNKDNETVEINKIIKNGSADLMYTSDKEIKRVTHVDGYNYFETKNANGNFVIINTKGEELFEIDDYEYLGDGYFLLSGENELSIDSTISSDNSAYVYDVRKKKITFDFSANYSTRFNDYYDHVIYYLHFAKDENNKQVTEMIAYDLSSQKELWRTRGSIEVGPYEHPLGFHKYEGAVNGYFLVESGNYYSANIYNKIAYPTKVVDLKTGKVIVDGNLDECDYTIECDEIAEHTFVLDNQHYLKIKYDDYLRVYDFNHKQTAEISLKTIDGVRANIGYIFSSGLFEVSFYNSSDYSKSKVLLYDVNGNVVLENREHFSYSKYEVSSYYKREIVSESSVVLSSYTNDYVIYDGKLIDTFLDGNTENIIYTKELHGNDNVFLIMEDKNESGETIKEIINLRTAEKHNLPDIVKGDSFIESRNGKYIIFLENGNYYVYNDSLELKYESKNMMIPINDEYILEIVSADSKGYIININNSSKKEITYIGNFEYEYSEAGFVTKDENGKYYLYAYN